MRAATVEGRDKVIVVTNAQSIAEMMPERQAELLAGLHQAKHAVARLPTIATDHATRDLPLDDEPTQISFRRVRMQRRFRPLQNPEQFSLAALQPRQPFVEGVIPYLVGKYPIDPDQKFSGCTLASSA
ncbi:hypothetical protein AX761_10650 [Rhizobium sp. 58]|nr:hypothetical protein AX761_10650 [Rhizobium sp. 58]